LRRLEYDTVQAIAWDLGELEALLLERVMRVSEADSALEQGFLLAELNERFALSPDDYDVVGFAPTGCISFAGGSVNTHENGSCDSALICHKTQRLPFRYVRVPD